MRKNFKNRQSPEESPQFDQESLKDKGFTISETWMYKVFVKLAYRLLQKPLTILQILKKAVARLQQYQNIKELSEDIRNYIGILIRITRAYVKGEYRRISKINVVLSLAAIIYFIFPVDIIPDFLVVGLVDDIALLVWVYDNMQSEIDAFLEWEDKQKIRIEIEAGKADTQRNE